MNNIQALRKQKGLSQSQFSKLSGINYRSLQKYEITPNADLSNIKVSVILKLCNALNCSVGALLESNEASEYDASH
jgi:transcriptional regulator with XRE-family HTH domain